MTSASFRLRQHRPAHHHGERVIRQIGVALGPCAGGAASTAMSGRPALRPADSMAGVPVMAPRPFAFLLPGQGAQHPRMAVGLYESEPDFAAIVDEFFEMMGPEGKETRSDWLSESPRLPVDSGRRAQPLLFVIGYAVGRLLCDRGVRPSVLLGHSVGELAAATLAGVFDLEAAARIMSARCRALDAAPPGGLLAVAAPYGQVLDLLGARCAAEGVAVGAVNAPRQTVLAGPAGELARVEKDLTAQGLTSRRVRAVEPFHSPVMDEVARQFEKAVARESLGLPRIPVQSSRTARPVGPEEAVDPAFWARQLAEPVLFWPALANLLDEGPRTVVETGPGRSLSAPALRHAAVREGRSEVVHVLPDERGDAGRMWREALERLLAMNARTHR
ncbi:acyltransferase domain-containing protein [Streptomyces sp. NPDC051172]|uniref:acyltransferase domain-containing protein n=1 Tax=Streptomyces sp. NPDC051172 TaxID=3155796 RepID=UPI003425E394